MELVESHKFLSPANWVICGQSGSGKSTFVHNLLIHSKKIFVTPPVKILYCYNIYQPLFDQMETSFPSITFHKGIPTEETIDNFGQSVSSHSCIIIDDLAHAIGQETELLFCQKSHHMNMSVIFITQNLFHQNKQNRTLQLNTHYYVIFKNFRDRGQISCLGRQLHGGKVLQIYTDLCRVMMIVLK